MIGRQSITTVNSPSRKRIGSFAIGIESYTKQREKVLREQIASSPMHRLVFSPGNRTPSSVEEFRALYPCSCAADAVVHPSKITLLVCWDQFNPLFNHIAPLRFLQISVENARHRTVRCSADACEDQSFVQSYEALDAS